MTILDQEYSIKDHRNGGEQQIIARITESDGEIFLKLPLSDLKDYQITELIVKVADGNSSGHGYGKIGDVSVETVHKRDWYGIQRGFKGVSLRILGARIEGLYTSFYDSPKILRVYAKQNGSFNITQLLDKATRLQMGLDIIRARELRWKDERNQLVAHKDRLEEQLEQYGTPVIRTPNYEVHYDIQYYRDELVMVLSNLSDDQYLRIGKIVSDWNRAG